MTWERHGMGTAWHGNGMACVNQIRAHCVNQMGKTQSKPLAEGQGRGTAWERYGMCESAFSGSSRIVTEVSALRIRDVRSQHTAGFKISAVRTSDFIIYHLVSL
jgi:hypothetical protein